LLRKKTLILMLLKMLGKSSKNQEL
ncbi:uncharacterized protein METZ01_LOCUS90219, partial [marine metagenome]